MKPKTEELLYHLLWACDVAARPTFRNLNDSFESWAYRHGFHRQLAALEQQQLVEVKSDDRGDRLHRLTATGRLRASGSRDPITRWNRRWDGKWRMVLFDVPQNRASERTRLRRALIERGFGFLQNSVWITPDPLTGERSAISSSLADVESLILLEARPCAGETNEEIVAGAWDFDAIRRCYECYVKVLERLPQCPVGESGARELHRWCRAEREAWCEVLRLDPLLPARLQPADYPGVKVWKLRMHALAKFGCQARAFRISTGS